MIDDQLPCCWMPKSRVWDLGFPSYAQSLERPHCLPQAIGVKRLDVVAAIKLISVMDGATAQRSATRSSRSKNSGKLMATESAP
jgi:hypothetical protein